MVSYIIPIVTAIISYITKDKAKSKSYLYTFTTLVTVLSLAVYFLLDNTVVDILYNTALSYFIIFNRSKKKAVTFVIFLQQLLVHFVNVGQFNGVVALAGMVTAYRVLDYKINKMAYFVSIVTVVIGYYLETVASIGYKNEYLTLAIGSVFLILMSSYNSEEKTYPGYIKLFCVYLMTKLVDPSLQLEFYYYFIPLLGILFVYNKSTSKFKDIVQLICILGYLFKILDAKSLWIAIILSEHVDWKYIRIQSPRLDFLTSINQFMTLTFVILLTSIFNQEGLLIYLFIFTPLLKLAFESIREGSKVKGTFSIKSTMALGLMIVLMAYNMRLVH